MRDRLERQGLERDALEQTSLEQTSLEQTSLEQTSLEQISHKRHGLKQHRVTLLAGGVLSAALVSWGTAACGNDDHERCVDSRTDTVINDSYCTDTSTTTSYAHWYRGGSGFKMGQHVSGGETGLHGVSRGGFGSHGGGEGGHGGHGG